MSDIKLSSVARTLLKKELRKSSEILKHIKSFDELNKANKAKLLDLASKCDIDINKIIQISKIGLSSKHKNIGNDTKKRNAKEFEINDQGNIPFQITIEALGHKRVLTAFYCYNWTTSYSINKDGEPEEINGGGHTSIKILDFLSEQNSEETNINTVIRDDLFSIGEIKPILLENPRISDVLPDIIDHFFIVKIQDWQDEDAKDEMKT